MECRNCELKQRQFFCANCIGTHTRDYRVQTQHFAVERDEQVAKATKALETMEGSRVRRANVAQIQGRLDELLSALTRLRKDNDKKRDRLRTLRESQATRRRTLAAANGLPSPPSPNANSVLAAPLAGLSTLSSLITRARAGLVQELVEVFNIVQVGGRPPLGGKAGSQGEWTIGDLILPVPGDVRRYPPQHINAVLGHAVHFVGLLAFYLGVKLPFVVNWDGGKLGVGVPWIGPGRGGWGRQVPILWTANHPLHLSLSPSPAPTASPSPSTTHSPTEDLSLSQSLSQSQLSQSTATLHPHSQPAAAEPEPPHFTTGLAMLLYDVMYLAHTQGLALPLAQAGDILGNLWAVCCAPELGRRSHATYATVNIPARDPNSVNVNALGGDNRLPPPAPGAFALDFGQVVQAAASGGGRRAGTGASGARRVSVGSFGASGAKGTTTTRVRKAPPQEEEEGWDIVSEDGY
ncbi:UV radiation resistance protein and autophagy-related subunit 14-domain-containing protein [Mycena filopes]|nr:UV radiation resistance protein and autophagy-related subunit 14-domain-containing protein [Mycena filopes]